MSFLLVKKSIGGIVSSLNSSIQVRSLCLCSIGHLYGLVDSGLVVKLDEHGFLHVVPASAVSKTQRRGRIDRIADGGYCCLTETTSEESGSLTYLEGLLVYLAAASLGLPWPSESMKDLIQPEVQYDLHRMGLLERTDHGLARTTSLGERMLAGHMDVTLNLLVALAEALQIRDIGLITAA